MVVQLSKRRFSDDGLLGIWRLLWTSLLPRASRFSDPPSRHAVPWGVAGWQPIVWILNVSRLSLSSSIGAPSGPCPATLNINIDGEVTETRVALESCVHFSVFRTARYGRSTVLHQKGDPLTGRRISGPEWRYGRNIDFQNRSHEKCIFDEDLPHYFALPSEKNANLNINMHAIKVKKGKTLSQHAFFEALLSAIAN